MELLSFIITMVVAPAPVGISNAVIVAPTVVSTQEPLVVHAGNGGTMWAFKCQDRSHRCP